MSFCKYPVSVAKGIVAGLNFEELVSDFLVVGGGGGHDSCKNLVFRRS